MGAAGTGKTKQLLTVVNFIEDSKKMAFVIDLEDKIEASLYSIGSTPKNMKLYNANSWDELVAGTNVNGKDMPSVLDQIEPLIKPDDWIMVDRVDLAWSFVQRWYTQNKYKEDLAELMMKKAVNITKSFMVAPRFDQGSWQVINEQYESFISKVLYKFRANVLLTCGVKIPEEGSNPLDAYGHIGVAPRGQKELSHQPHSVFLLSQKRQNREITWQITTAKDLPGRVYMDHEDLFDFGIQYLAQYVKG